VLEPFRVPEGAITAEELEPLRQEFEPLLGLKLDWLSLPELALPGFEPSQIAVIINTLLDAALPQISLLSLEDAENAERLMQLGLSKAPREIGEREGYPDFIHKSGKRVELKGLYVDNPALAMKRPPTRREPSARLKENVTFENVDPANDALLVAATQLQVLDGKAYPVIVDLGMFSMIECLIARESRLRDSPGKWIDNVPKVLSLKGRAKVRTGIAITDADYEKDTNFGKLNRIPHPPLVEFLRKHGYFPPRSRKRSGTQGRLGFGETGSLPML
jgi:hypothetical protein